MSEENSVSSLKQSSDTTKTDDTSDSEFSHRGCCSWFPFTTSSTSSSSSPQHHHCWGRFRRGSDRTDDTNWIIRSWKNLRGWSELAAGPKWKTFIRRFGKNRTSNGKFGYDPMSYSLNFDEGQNEDLDEGTAFRDFSSRYAAIPASAKSSMDFGKDDGRSFLGLTIT